MSRPRVPAHPDPAGLELRLSGTGGQGLILAGLMVAEALAAEGWRVAHSQNFEPLSRGGVSRSDVVASTVEVDFPLVTRLDMVIVLDQIAAPVSEGLVKDDGLVLVDSDRVTTPPTGNFRLISLPLTARAIELGNPRVANVLSLGALVELGGICRMQSMEQAVRTHTPRRSLPANLAAMQEGHRMAAAVSRADPG
ncbi:MAG: pyruvate ferredoxin oxidoreductase [bacterium]|nr:pyruvate ferredoxin oxidoreductase [bacterium]